MRVPEVQTPGGNRAGTEQNTADDAIVDQAGDGRKATERMHAETALAGCGLYRLACGGWPLKRWGVAKECPDLRAVAALLARMGSAR